MKDKSAHVLRFIVYFLFFALFSVSVHADGVKEISTGSAVNHTAVWHGDEIEYTFSLLGYTDVKDGINVVKGTFVYDNAIFGNLDAGDFKLFNSWENFFYNKNTGEFIAIHRKGSKEAEEIFRVTLKASDDFRAGESYLGVKEVSVSQGKDDIFPADSAVKIDLISETQGAPSDNKPSGEASPNAGTSGEKPSGEASPDTGISGGELADSGYPGGTAQDGAPSGGSHWHNTPSGGPSSGSQQFHDMTELEQEPENENAGAENHSLFALFVLALCISLLVLLAFAGRAVLARYGYGFHSETFETLKRDISGFLKRCGEYIHPYRNYRFWILGIFLAILLIILAVTGYALNKKGELNGDGIIDEADVILLEKHLVSLEQLSENQQKSADMNTDQTLSVTDVSLLLKKADSHTEYTVSLASAMDSPYVEKGKDIALQLVIHSDADAETGQVVVNDTPYEAVPQGNSRYLVTLPAINEAGVKELHISKVILKNETEVAVDFTQKIDVLKTPAEFLDFRTEQVGNTNRMRVNVYVHDTDGTINSAGLRVVKVGTSKIVQEEVIAAGENAFTLTLEKNTDYNVHIFADIRRDSGELDDGSGGIIETVAVTKTVRLNADYRFTFGDVKVYSLDMKEVAEVARNEKFLLGFRFSSPGGYGVDSVRINGASYPVVLRESRYVAELPAFTETGEKTLAVESVVMDNGKTFTPNQDNTATVLVTKAAPLASGVTISEHADNLHVSFTLEDADAVLTESKLIIKDATGAILFEKVVSPGQVEEQFPLQNVLTSAFQIEVVANYDTGSSAGAALDQVLYAEAVAAKPRARVIEAAVDQKHVEAGETVKLTFRLQHNREDTVTAAVVNNQILPVTTEADGSYTASYEVNGSAGKYSLALSYVVFAQTRVEAPFTLETEILKAVPSVSGFQAEDDFEQEQVNVTFDIVDYDNAFISGYTVLTGTPAAAGLQTVREEITAPGTQNFGFHVQRNEVYDLKIYLHYARAMDGSYEEKDVLVKEITIQLLDQYNLKITDLMAEKQYVEKHEAVKIFFTGTTDSVHSIQSVQADGVLHPAAGSGADRYEATLPGYSQSGVKTIELTRVVMSNGKELKVQGNGTVQAEVLKTAPSVEGFASEQTADDKLNVTFDVVDTENTILDGVVRVEAGGTELASQKISVGKNTMAVPMTSDESYKVSVLADYDLDSNTLTTTDNEVKGGVLFETEIPVTREAIELKDITGVKLYQKTVNGSQEVTSIDIRNGMPVAADYYAAICCEALPDLYVNIKEFRLDASAKKLQVVADQEDIIQREDGARKNGFAFDIAYVDQDGSHAPIKSAEEFFKRIEHDLDGTFELTEDLDASSIPAASAAIPGTFRGKLIGNGHRIWNLHTSLFTAISGGTVENLIIENAEITNANGILANEVNKRSVIDRVFIVDSSISNDINMVGGFAGRLNDSVTKSSAAININVLASNTIGGMYGQTDASAVIEDCYVTGTLQGTLFHGSLGSRVGGFVGWHNGTLERVFAKVDITSPNQFGSAGLIGGPDAGQPVMRDAFVLTNGTVYRTAGFSTFGNAATENLYEYKNSTAATNITDVTGDKIKEIDDATLQQESFYTDILGFDTDIWSLDLVSHGKLPSLQADPASKELADYEIQENVNGIPGYADVRRHKGYQADRELAYKNLSILMPFADISVWIERGNALDASSNFVQKRIGKILPLSADGKLLTGLADQEPGAVATLRIHYTDGAKEVYGVTYRRTLGTIVAAYQMEGSSLGYQFPKYVSRADSAWISQIAAKAAGWSYDDIAAFTPELESRLYRDYYDMNVKNRVAEILTKLIASQENYPSYLQNETVEKGWKAALEDDDRLKEILYAYNYYDKWYHINFGGIILSDMMYFSGTIFSPEMTADQLTKDLIGAGLNDRKTESNYVYYTNVLQKKYTGKELMDFLGELATTLTDAATPSDWFADEFQGVFLERQLNSTKHQPKYRVWDVMCNLEERKKIVLPILTAPQEDMYVMSMPTQLMIGSMNLYNNYHTEGKQAIQTMMATQSEMIANFYGTSVDWVPDGERILSSFTNISYDSITDFPASGDIEGGTQVAGKTNDPVIKWVYEAVGEVRTSSGWVGAFANGNDVFWVINRALEKGSYMFTHETAHNQEAKYFYNGYGRRSYTGAEAHTDGNITQFGSIDGENYQSVFNLVYDGSPDLDIATNFSYKRIRTAETVHTYYQGMFETRYVLDYLAAQAFLELSPKEQAQVAVQVKEQKDADGLGMSVEFTAVSEDEIAAMHLRGIEDLWANKLMWRTATGSSTSARGGNANHRGSFYDMPWYQAHNDTGTGDSESFKRLGQEMLGYAGYADGYIRFMSDYVNLAEKKLPTDLAVLQSITGDPDMTWEKYKLGRFQTVADNLDAIPYFDPAVVQAEFKAAFQADAEKGTRGDGEAERVKRFWYGVVKRATNEFAAGDIYGEASVKEVNSAQELISAVEANPMGYYRLGQDIDFTDIQAGASYVTGSFYGILDGAGHKMTNVHYALFQDAKYVHAKNLTIETPTYLGASKAVIAETGKNITLTNITVTDADTHLPLILTKSGTYQEYGCQVNYLKTTINSVEDFMKIGDSDADLRKDYVLGADLDFSGQAPDGLYVLNKTFFGSLDGAGHTIKGLTGTLLHKIQGGTIRNVRIADTALDHLDIKGSLANTADGATLQDIQLENISIRVNVDEGKGNVGGLVGTFTNGSASKITAANVSVEAPWSLGGIFGNTEHSSITDVVVQGTINARYYNYNTGNNVGGVTGNAAAVTLDHVYTKVTIVEKYGSTVKGLGSGGIVGNGSAVTIRNSVSASTGAYSYRIADPKLLETSSNVYELQGSDAATNITESNQDRIHEVTQDQLRSKDFYVATLGWPEELWDFTNIENTGVPALRTVKGQP